MCTNNKALLHDNEDSFNARYLLQYSDTDIELLIVTGQRGKNSGNYHSYMCVFMHACGLLLSYSDQPEQGDAY